MSCVTVFLQALLKSGLKKQWKVVSSALVDLGLDQTEGDRLKTVPIDDDTERRIEEEVNKWKLETEPRVETLEDKVQRLEGESRNQADQNTSELADCLPDKVANVFDVVHKKYNRSSRPL